MKTIRSPHDIPGLIFLLLAVVSPPLWAGGLSILQTTRQGDRLKPVEAISGNGTADHTLLIDTKTTHQTLVGIGGALTEASAQAMSELSKKQSEAVMKACFSSDGARYSLTRTHIGSCDFSLTNYSYAPVPDDMDLRHFTIEPDRKYLLPSLKQALAEPGADFKILSSPWTAPPWMKTNGAWNGGSLKKEHYKTFANYITRYIEAYRKEGVPVWGITPENEPLGNGGQWESLHFTAAEMRDFIGGHLGPALAALKQPVTLWAYDQNRDKNLIEWADTILADKKAASYVTGLAVHWYQTTRDIGAGPMAAVNKAHPGTQMMHTEGCIDAAGDDEPVGSWLEDDWYWREDATDWGYRWAPPEDRADHPKYRPFYRYARDLIGGFNAGLVGWIDWNLALNFRGGPNHARNFCVAPILIDSGHDAVYFTPLYHAISHFSKYIRPGAKRVEIRGHDDTLMATAFLNPDGSTVAVAFNLTEKETTYTLALDGGAPIRIAIPGQALQTIVWPAK